MATWDLNWDLTWDLNWDLTRDQRPKRDKCASGTGSLSVDWLATVQGGLRGGFPDHERPSCRFGVWCQFQVPRHLGADGGGVALDGGEARIGARFKPGDLPLARMHALGDLDLGHSAISPQGGELAKQLATLEGGGDPAGQTGIVDSQLVDEGVEVVLWHEVMVTQI